LLGGIISGVAALIQTARSHEADKDLELIRESLIGFLLENGRLPCADTDNDGMENGPTPCSNWGTVPYAQLGVSREDPWGGNYRYRVNTNFADDPFPASTPLSTFGLTENGNINVKDGAGSTVATGMAAIVVSEGANRGNGSADEVKNTDDNNNFVQKTYSNVTGSEFDDKLIWISPLILKAKMLEAGRLP
jgi:hypothetical protein